MNATPTAVAPAPGAAAGAAALGSRSNGTQSFSPVPDRLRLFCDLDGPFLCPKARRAAAYRAARDRAQHLLGPHLPEPLAELDTEEFWQLFRRTGDVAKVALRDIPDQKLAEPGWVKDNIRGIYDGVVATYHPDHLALDVFPEARRAAMREILQLGKASLVTFRGDPARQLTHLSRLGVIAPGDGCFKAEDVHIVGGRHKAVLAKATEMLRRFGDAIDRHIRTGIWPILIGDALSDFDVALMTRCWFVGITEDGEATKETFERKIEEEARHRGVPIELMPVTLFPSVTDPALLRYLEKMRCKFERRVGHHAAFSHRPPARPDPTSAS